MEHNGTVELKTSPPPPDPGQVRLRVAQIRLFYAQSGIGSAGALLGAMILGGALWNLVSHDRIIVWLLAYVALFLGRHCLIHRFHRQDRDDNEVIRWGKWHGLLVNAGGLLWGIASVWLFPQDSILHQFLLAIFVAGIAAAGTIIYSPTKDYAANLLLTLLPLSGRFIYEFDEFHVTVGGVIVLFSVALLLTGRKMHGVYADSLSLRNDKEELVEDLKQEIGRRDRLEAELKKARDDLETQVEARTAELRTLNRALEQEIVERKRTGEALKQREEHLRLVLNAGADGFWHWDLTTGQIWRSPGWTRILGYRLEETEPDLGAWDRLVHPDDLPRVMQAINDHLAGLTPGYSNEYRILTKSGEWMWIQDRGKVIEHDEGGKPLRVAGAFHDISDRKRAEKELQESEDKFRSLFESSLDGILLTAPDGKVFNANQAACRILGRTEQDLRESGREGVVDSSDPRLFPALEERNRTGRFTGELNFKLKDGTIFPAEISSALFKTANGESRANIVVRDITERKNAEEELRQSKAELQAIYEHAPVMMCVLDGQRQVLYANCAFADFVGKHESELKGGRACGVFGCINALDDPRGCGYGRHCGSCPLLSAIEDTYKTGVSHRAVEYRATLAGAGYQRDVVLLGSTALIQPGEQSSVLLCLEDVTERKRAEEALRASEEKYKLLVGKAQEAIFVIQDTVFRFVNPRMEEIVGSSSDELIGSSYGSLLHPDDRETVIERHYRRLKGEVFPSRYEIRIIDKQGRVKWAEIDSVLIDWEDKPAIMVFLTDITYRKLAEDAAVQTERLRAIADLSSGVAHHFNNLLQIVMASGSLSLADLETGDLTEIKNTLEKMLEAATHGSEMVRRLQTFANTRADIAKEEAAIFDVATTARNAAEISEPLWKAQPEKKGVKVNVQLDLAKGCLVQGRENEIFEVLVNLIRNAAEALPDGGDIEVKAFKEADEAVIKVRDTGVGIAADDLPRLFQPFWSSKGVGIGKGMGLAVTHGLVKRHGGTISVQSEVGAGTTFTIRLPRAPEPVGKTEQSETSTAGDRLTILVIEDEGHIAALLERIFEKAGHRVFKTLSGEEGLAVFDKELLDLVVCDLGMPRMNGWDVGTAIRLVCREKGISKPPFVLLTGWGGQELEREKIADSGTDAVIPKPIDSAALLATVREITSRFTGKPHGE
jgi:PAS domain S-box-containing protein